MKYIAKEEINTYIEKNSKFISICFPVVSLEDFLKKLKEVKETYKSATHYTFALRILTERGTLYEKFSDDKEPYGTAGIPMLKILKSNSLVNSAVVTVRYFGGVKLGKGNLLRAYMDAINLVLRDATFEDLVRKVEYSIELSYKEYKSLSYIFEKREVEVISKEFGETVKITLRISESDEGSIISKFEALPCIKVQKFFHPS